MRMMNIRTFESVPAYDDLGEFIRGRMLADYVVSSHQAVPLVAYMAWPNDTEARDAWYEAHICSDWEGVEALSKQLMIIQRNWGKVGDIFHQCFDLSRGKHQLKRGGASVGKAIALTEANVREKGSAHAQLWKIWAKQKDVAHLITAAVVVASEAQYRHRLAPYGAKLHQLQPFRIAMLLPELVLSLGMSFQEFGLSEIPHGRTEPLLNPETLWRIPADIGLQPIEPAIRGITDSNKQMLKARRAGNRGVRNLRKDKIEPSDLIL